MYELGWGPEDTIGPIVRWKPSQMGGLLAGVQGTMASMGTAIFGTGSTTPRVLRTEGTRMAVPTGRPGAMTERPPPASAQRSDLGSFGDGPNPRYGGTGILLAWDACRCE